MKIILVSHLVVLEGRKVRVNEKAPAPKSGGFLTCDYYRSLASD
jgi:hypothetical protein